MNPVEQLKSVLCDPEGKCCITGSDEDRAIVDKALQALAQPAVTESHKQEPLKELSRYEPEIYREDRIRMELDSIGEWVKYVDVVALIAQSPQPAQPEQEPVAIVIEDLEHDGQGWCSKVRWIYNPVPVGETLSWEQSK